MPLVGHAYSLGDGIRYYVQCGGWRVGCKRGAEHLESLMRSFKKSPQKESPQSPTTLHKNFKSFPRGHWAPPPLFQTRPLHGGGGPPPVAELPQLTTDRNRRVLPQPLMTTEGSAFRRGAAIAAAGGGRPSVYTGQAVLATSSQRAEHLDYMATREAHEMREAARSGRPTARQRTEALRWQLSGVTKELDRAQDELQEKKAALAEAEQTWRRVLEASRKDRR